VPGGIKSNPEITFRFVLSHPGVSCAPFGMSTIEMVEKSAVTTGREEPLSEEERAQTVEAFGEMK
jgi:predicted aldo/keto reductase-like oxidoreductase